MTKSSIPIEPVISDSVTQTNVKVLADAPAMAIGSLYQALGHSVGMMYENASQSQKALVPIYLDAVEKGLAQSDVPDNMLAFLMALRVKLEKKDAG